MIVDRMKFTKSIHSDCPTEEIIKTYFDETMGIYDLVGSYDLSVTRIHGDYKNSMFDVTFVNMEDVISLYTLISAVKDISVYGKKFILDAKHTNNTVYVSLKEEIYNGSSN